MIAGPLFYFYLINVLLEWIMGFLELSMFAFNRVMSHVAAILFEVCLKYKSITRRYGILRV